MSAQSPQKEMATLGPFYVTEHKAGSYILLKRNPNYWKKDAAGKQLPYLDSVRLDIEQNPEIEALRYRRGEIHLISVVSPAFFEKTFCGKNPNVGPGRRPVHDNRTTMVQPGAGFSYPSLQTGVVYFHKFPAGPSRKRLTGQTWRGLFFHGRAQPAIGIVSPSNKFWFNTSLKPHPYDTADALRKLRQDGFRLDVRDAQGQEW